MLWADEAGWRLVCRRTVSVTAARRLPWPGLLARRSVAQNRRHLGSELGEQLVERLEPTTVFAYTWGIYGLPDSDERRTYVEFTLADDGSGTTVTVVESGFAQLAPDEHDTAFNGNTAGWRSEFDELVAYLHG